MVFHDGRREQPGDGWGVVAWAQTLVGALRNMVDPHIDAAGRLDRSELADVAAAVQRVAGQLPVLADRLTAAVDRWSRTGRLYANARDLPPMEDMPEDRVSAVIAGRQVRARGTDLDRLRLAVGRAADLSTRLPDALPQAAEPGRPARQPLAGRHAPGARVSRMAQRQLGRAQDDGRDIAPLRSSSQVTRAQSPSR